MDAAVLILLSETGLVWSHTCNCQNVLCTEINMVSYFLCCSPLKGDDGVPGVQGFPGTPGQPGGKGEISVIVKYNNINNNNNNALYF